MFQAFAWGATEPGGGSLDSFPHALQIGQILQYRHIDAASAFSFAYVDLSAGTGALLLFRAVQAIMILFGLCKGERLNLWDGNGEMIVYGPGASGQDMSAPARRMV